MSGREDEREIRETEGDRESKCEWERGGKRYVPSQDKRQQS